MYHPELEIEKGFNAEEGRFPVSCNKYNLCINANMYVLYNLKNSIIWKVSRYIYSRYYL